MQAIEWFDIIIVGAILILGIKGALNGLIREIFGLVGLIGGLIVATRFSDVMGEFIAENVYKIENVSLLGAVAFVSLWLIFWIACLLIGKILAKLVGVSGLGFLDRIGGFIAGSGKIFLVLAAVLAVISNTNLNDKIAPYFKDSSVYPVLLSTGKWLANMDVNAIKDDVSNVVMSPLGKDEIIDEKTENEQLIEALKDSAVNEANTSVEKKIERELEKFVNEISNTSENNTTKGVGDGN